MKMYAFNSGGDVLDNCIADPFDRHVGEKIYTPWFFYLIVHPRGNVIFDTGVDPSVITDDPRKRFGDWADALDLRMNEGDDVVSKLATVGLAPKDVDVVVLSHMHFDHAAALPLFPDARIVVQRAELMFARHPAVYQAGTYHAPDFAGDHNWALLDGPLDIFGDGRVEVFPAPGHTPGSQILLFRGEDDRVLLLGDATYSLPKMRQRRLPSFYWNPDLVVSSWEFIEWLEKKEGATLLYSHDPDYESRVRLAPDAFYS